MQQPASALLRFLPAFICCLSSDEYLLQFHMLIAHLAHPLMKQGINGTSPSGSGTASSLNPTSESVPTSPLLDERLGANIGKYMLPSSIAAEGRLFTVNIDALKKDGFSQSFITSLVVTNENISQVVDRATAGRLSRGRLDMRATSLRLDGLSPEALAKKFDRCLVGPINKILKNVGFTFARAAFLEVGGTAVLVQLIRQGGIRWALTVLFGKMAEAAGIFLLTATISWVLVPAVVALIAYATVC